MADTHIVHDTFIIIQNCKAKLFNELKKFQHKNLDSNFIKYRAKISKALNRTEKNKVQPFDRYNLKDLSSATAAPPARDELVNFDQFISEDQHLPSGSIGLEGLVETNHVSQPGQSVREPSGQPEGDSEDQTSISPVDQQLNQVSEPKPENKDLSRESDINVSPSSCM
jgi:hypothetical protein